jgi:Domain of unknown function (DUF4351)
MTNILEERQKNRLLLLQKIYNITEETSRKNSINLYKVGDRLGWNREKTEAAFEYLQGEGLLQGVTVGGGVKLTHQGIRKVEEAEEQELIMQLSPLYLAEIQAAEDRGRQIGERREEVLITRLLNRRVGDISLQIQEKIKSLPLEKLDDLGEALLDFTGIEDLTAWLDTNS